MWHLLSYCIFTGTYLAMQYLLIFKCINVEHKRRLLLAVTIVYSVIYSTIGFLLGSHDDFDTSLTIQILYNINHTLNTFILMLIIAVGSSEFLPRNFLIATFYYDFLTLLPWPHKLFSGFLVKKYAAEGIDVTNSIYTTEPAMILIVAINYCMLVVVIWGVYLFFNRQLKRLVAKVPDYICSLAFFITFFMYVCRCVYELRDYADQVRYKPYTEAAFPYLINGLLAFSIIIIILLVSYTARRALIRRIQETEARFQFHYYTNVTGIYKEVRHLRHDLANHLTVIGSADGVSSAQDSGAAAAYRDSLLATCSAIREKVAQQLAWQEIDLDILSSREKFEIYQYTRLLAQKLKKDKLEIKLDKDNGSHESRLRFTIGDKGRGPLRLLLLKARVEYRLIKAIAAQHLGNVSLKNTEEDGKKCIMLDLTL